MLVHLQLILLNSKGGEAAETDCTAVPKTPLSDL